MAGLEDFKHILDAVKARQQAEEDGKQAADAELVAKLAEFYRQQKITLELGKLAAQHLRGTSLPKSVEIWAGRAQATNVALAHPNIKRRERKRLEAERAEAVASGQSNTGWLVGVDSYAEKRNKVITDARQTDGRITYNHTTAVISFIDENRGLMVATKEVGDASFGLGVPDDRGFVSLDAPEIGLYEYGEQPSALVPRDHSLEGLLLVSIHGSDPLGMLTSIEQQRQLAIGTLLVDTEQ